MSEEKIMEFLGKMNHPEVTKVKGLGEESTLTSILDLILSSEEYCKTLVKVLGEAHISRSISEEQFSRLVDHLLDSNVISFADDDIPNEGRGHRKPLHIAVISSGYIMNGVLIDGGSALNICPFNTLKRMNINPKRLRASHVVVRAFDGSRRETVGEIELPIEIGPYTFDIPFQVLDIAASYNMLLGRPWIHMAGAVPSTLHQQVKFIIDGSLVTISAEQDDPSHSMSGLPVISLEESMEPASYSALEISTPHYRCLGAPAVKPKVSPELTFVAKEMMKMNFQPGQGLGRSNQGIKEPIQLPTQVGKAGLGYFGCTKQEPYQGRIPAKLAGFLMPKISQEPNVNSPVPKTGGRPSQGRIPTRLAGILMPKVNQEPSINSPVSETGGENLGPVKGELAKKNDFLQEVFQQFETKCYIPEQPAGSGKGKEVASSSGTQQSTPIINWAGLLIPEEVVTNSQGDVAVIIEEVPDVTTPFICRIPADLTTDNWTVEPVVTRQG